ncbi:MAG: twin-arginine translocase TatA/TatE family subunit [Lentisphaeria bacterium]
MNFGLPELLLVFGVVLLFFGGKKIPEIARGLGKGLREFRKARDEVSESIEEKAAPTETKPAAPPPPPTDALK